MTTFCYIDFSFQSSTTSSATRPVVVPFPLRSVPPFDSGEWSLVHHGTSTVTYSLRWLNIDEGSTEGVVGLKTSIVVGGIRYGEASFSSSNENIPFTGSMGASFSYTSYASMYTLRVEWQRKKSSTEGLSVGARLAGKHRAFLGPPLLNKAHFVFPDDPEKRELWADVDVLTKASPYFKDLFTTGFKETNKDAFSDSIDAASSDLHCSPSFHSFPHHHVSITESNFVTYQAVLCWIYTKHIVFAPLLSSFPGNLEEAHAARAVALSALASETPDLPLPASPKAVFRLAHYLDLKDLQATSLAALRKQLTQSNVATELVSETSAHYDQVSDMIIEYVRVNRGTLADTRVWSVGGLTAADGLPAQLVWKLASRLCEA